MKNGIFGKPDNSYLTKRSRLDILESQMRNERTSWEAYWRDLSDYILPRRSRFFITDSNRGDRRNRNIIDNSATLSSRTLSSGMMTGITSPARPWFKIRTSMRDLNESKAVKEYFKIVEDEIRSAFLKSNLYNQLPVLYGDLGTFGTGGIFMQDDTDNVFNFTSFLTGSYMIGHDHLGRVNTFYREFEMSVYQVVEKFGMDETKNPEKINWNNISDAVKYHWELGQYETKIDISHFILPNEMYKPGSPLSKNKKYISYYYERGINQSTNHPSLNTQQPDKFLSEKGFDLFPFMSPRWEVAGEDTYGSQCPGMMCLGDVKQLQLQEKRIAEALDQKVRPSMVGPTALKNIQSSILPGDITYLDEQDGTSKFRRLFEVDFDIRELEGKQNQLRQRISKTFYEDLFLMLANSDRRQITATEIEERHEEKLLALGPVLERINQDLLDPLIQNAYISMTKRGLLPEVPEELLEQDYEVEYISVMAQAQKLAGIGSIERFTGFVGNMAQLDPNAINKMNLDNIIDEYGDKLGVDPSMLRTKDEMEAIREEQAAAAQAEQEAMQAQQMVEAGKTLSETNINEDTALAQVLGGVGE